LSRTKFYAVDKISLPLSCGPLSNLNQFEKYSLPNLAKNGGAGACRVAGGNLHPTMATLYEPESMTMAIYDNSKNFGP
jgi:hypothetical protein